MQQPSPYPESVCFNELLLSPSEAVHYTGCYSFTAEHIPLDYPPPKPRTSMNGLKLKKQLAL